jgi:hypothetical protein
MYGFCASPMLTVNVTSNIRHILQRDAVGAAVAGDERGPTPIVTGRQGLFNLESYGTMGASG